MRLAKKEKSVSESNETRAGTQKVINLRAVNVTSACYRVEKIYRLQVMSSFLADIIIDYH